MNASLRQLRAFVHLCDERNFTRAAAAIHLSQPAFSALIVGLEESLGVRLFDRTRRLVVPTPEGAEFEASARRVLAEFDIAIESMHDRTTLRRGHVSIALLPSLAAGWLPTVLARYRSAHPNIAVTVSDVLSEPCIERVTSAHADFALAAVRAETPALQAELFCSDDFHLVCRADHPLAEPGRAIRTRDLAAWPFVHLSRTSSVRQYLEAALHPQAMNTLMEVDQLATVMGMVRAGLGISVVPALTLFHFQHPEIAIRPLRLPGLQRHIYLVRRRERTLSLAAQSLYDLMLADPPVFGAKRKAATSGRPKRTAG